MSISFFYIGNIFAFIPNSFSAKFEQVYKSSLTGKDKRSSGRIDYKYPKNVKLEIKKPEQTIFVSNSQKSWYYSPPFIEGEAGSLTIKKRQEGPARLFDILKKGLKSNKSYKVKKIKNRFQITFSPKIVKKMDIAHAFLTFSGSNNFIQLKTVSIEYVNRPTVTLHFSEIKQNITFDNQYFQFFPPPNTRLNN
ncbi:MAG: outer membrane lipoprotein carrier protein LolA [Halobacteriovoraceae bacterium]|nr:outer membrane lipoprotein carrier protein LolA [Halobacteriovoraceae bacterium]